MRIALTTVTLRPRPVHRKSDLPPLRERRHARKMRGPTTIRRE